MCDSMDCGILRGISSASCDEGITVRSRDGGSSVLRVAEEDLLWPFLFFQNLFEIS